MKLTLHLLIALFSFSFASAQFTINQPPDVYLCGDQGGFVIYNFENVAEIVLGALPAQNYTVSYHQTQLAAVGDGAAITSVATSTSPQTFYVRIEENVNPNNYEITSFLFVINPSPPVTQQVFTACDNNTDGFTMIDLFDIHEQIWASAGLSPNGYSINIYETTNDAFNGVNALSGSFSNIVAFQFPLYAMVTDSMTGCQTFVPVQVLVAQCSGSGPVDIIVCSDSSPTCFNLSQNDALILDGLNPSEYTLTYHLTIADAENNTNPIPNPANFCTDAEFQPIYARLETNVSGSFQILNFNVVSQSTTNSTIQLTPMSQCDENNDGMITFDLTTAAAQLNTTNALAYYNNLNDANGQVNAMQIPSSFTISTSTNVGTVIFIRETVVGDCDIIHSLQVNAQANCNVANICSAANSLCNSLGIPFANTVNIGSAQPFYYACLGSTPNPTWFYIPVSDAGNINLMIEQNSSINFNAAPLDVDYICYGPFTDPVSPCSNPSLIANSVVSCSFSTAAVEYPNINNAQAGQYYLFMVTNYSNQPGYIRITELSSTQGEIDCTGISLNAFLDSNGNGTFDVGESPFPLGQFHYEMNTDGVVHNIISPSGQYNIYDLNPGNSYDIGYTIDAAYIGNYSLATPAYFDVSVVPGAGMQEYYFPITVSQAYNDLAVTIIPNQAPRPGFLYTNTIHYSNLGSQTIVAGTVSFTHDPLVTINAVSQTGTVTNASGFTYGFSNLLPFESRDITVTMQVPNLPIVALGDLLTNSADIIPLTGDVSPENNLSVSAQEIIGSFDPNDKMESRGGQILITDFTSQDYLYYTVRFENTGTASAINVKITDVLHESLDAASISMVDASHNYVLDRTGHNLQWKFDNIMLPGANSASALPNTGYVVFKVKPLPGYAVGDIIPNTASIYFDFNPAIITNTFITEFVSQLAVGEFAENGFSFYPNPVTDFLTINLANDSIREISIVNMVGEKVMNKQNLESGTETLDLSLISSGVYILQVTSTNNVTTHKKLIIQ